MKTSEVLVKALDVLNERGWYQGYYENDNGNVCAIGAVNVVVYGEALVASEGCLDPVDALTACAPVVERGYNIASYNDKDTTTEEDVKMVFKQAIALAEEYGE